MAKSNIIFGICCILFTKFSHAQQAKWPIDMYLPEYGYLAISNNVNLMDTVKIAHSESIFFRFVFFDSKGKSYCEVFKNNKLIQKGYYENSLDTLKTYTRGKSLSGNVGSKIQIHKYFQPLKDGEWVELIRGKYVKKRYSMGIEIKNR